MMKKFKNVDEYIKSFPKDTALKLETLRKIVKRNAPKAEEGISYGMPSYKLNGGVLVYFSAHKKHIGLYPYPSVIKEFKKESGDYRTSTGTIQFPLDKKLPLALITKMVKYRIKEKLTKN